MGLLFDDGELDSPRIPLTSVSGAPPSGNNAGSGRRAASARVRHANTTWSMGEQIVADTLAWCVSVSTQDASLEIAVSLTGQLGKLTKALNGLQMALVGRIDELTAPPDPVVEPGMPEPKKQRPLPLPGDHRDLPGLLESSGSQSKRTALDEIKNAQAVRDWYPKFGGLIREGELSSAYIKVLNRYIPPEMRPRASADEEALLGLALSSNPEKFAQAVKKWVFQHSPTEAEREAKHAALKQHLKVFPADGGYRVSGWFTALNGLQLDRALRKIIGVPSQSDPRDHGQRCADAFIDALHGGREAGEREAGEVKAGEAEHPTSAGGAPNAIGRRLPRTQILVHVPLATLVRTEEAIGTGCAEIFSDAGAAGQLGRGSPRPPSINGESARWLGESGTSGERSSSSENGWLSKDGSPPDIRQTSAPPSEGRPCAVSGEGLGRHGECLEGRRELSSRLGRALGEIKAGLAHDLLDGFEPATLEDGTALAPTELATLLCDSSLSRIVLTAHGEPLDASRAQRTFSATQAKAVLARDRTCRYPNCNRGSEVSEIHHAQEWERNGATVVDNAALLCWHHHQTVHANAVTITHHAGGFIFSRPNGSLIGVRTHEGRTP